jgi:hypothetical protein
MLRATASPGSTAVRLTADANAATTNNINNIADIFSFAVDVVVVGRDTTTYDTARFSGKLLLTRGAGVGTTAIVGGTVTLTKDSGTSGTTAWTVSASADTTNGGLNITATGAGSNTIRWAARVLNAVEMQ